MQNSFALHAAECRGTIETQYASAVPAAYVDWVQGNARSKDAAFLWSYGVVLGALARGCQYDPQIYVPEMDSHLKVLESYWTSGNPGGYAVLPGQDRDPDRYYDDNAWVALHLLEAYAATNKPEYLSVAKRALDYALSGEDAVLCGGLYWRERERHSKNACSNAPTAVVCYGWSLATGDRSYEAAGDRLMSWLQRLVDADGLVFDCIHLDGKIDQTKWTYNAACYAEALLLRYRLHHRAEDRSRATQTLESALKKWVNSETGAVDNPGYFAMHLVDALFLGARVLDRQDFAETAVRITRHLEACRKPGGLYAEHWLGPPAPNDKLVLLTQAAVWRTYLTAACQSSKATAQRGLF